ncbi:MAG: hypothetical protein DKM50_08480 [Candidatus Margulisiibacteriota bacterium]|nr:MAG: hypothetical protein A2X43_11965 [Candidatus Margulisbacteria bacterium GWD2_39_127]OGI01855.1 MAG: hypothetical protein A2X42_04490 [Candidatus Margulisbacteria bacterium GWF2_38_17]OGI10177.1 MAG: hypothetical protein A2X41_01210 [Candidatus Margulisbacteria bacterium GWE2_39_32]PZM79486.1 MAG: hypothetical protein DKM50_08480 [Candidatus Margulisiibacteriota bacterium]HAR63843.1 hypothetical protein [Candidatus Margulisiibacteriota bacterium]
MVNKTINNVFFVRYTKSIVINTIIVVLAFNITRIVTDGFSLYISSHINDYKNFDGFFYTIEMDFIIPFIFSYFFIKIYTMFLLIIPEYNKKERSSTLKILMQVVLLVLVFLLFMLDPIVISFLALIVIIKPAIITDIVFLVILASHHRLIKQIYDDLFVPYKGIKPIAIACLFLIYVICGEYLTWGRVQI